MKDKKNFRIHHQKENKVDFIDTRTLANTVNMQDPDCLNKFSHTSRCKKGYLKRIERSQHLPD